MAILTVESLLATNLTYDSYEMPRTEFERLLKDYTRLALSWSKLAQ